ncbi:MAG: hypothetical protein V3T70_09715, partial [Phycisphaerae bacterium]
MNGAPYGKWLPWNTAAHGGDVDQLINVVHWFMVLLFVGWGVFFVYCLVRFRARPARAANYQLPAAKPSKYIEVAVAVFEAVLLIGFSMPAWAAYKLEPPPEGDRLELRAVGEQFAWNFHYPGPDGEYGRSDPKLISPSNLLGVDFDNDPAAADDIVSPEMHVKVNTPVHVTVTSKDVIHSFAITTMRVKQDAFPGMHVSVWFTPTMTNTEFRQGMVDDHELDLENAWFAEKKLPSLL